MMQKSHITKEKGDCPQAVPQKKNPQLHRFLEFRNALFDLLRLLLIQRQLALLLLHQRGGRLAHKARIVQLALSTGDFLVQVVEFLAQARDFLLEVHQIAQRDVQRARLRHGGNGLFRSRRRCFQ